MLQFFLSQTVIELSYCLVETSNKKANINIQLPLDTHQETSLTCCAFITWRGGSCASMTLKTALYSGWHLLPWCVQLCWAGFG